MRCINGNGHFSAQTSDMIRLVSANVIPIKPVAKVVGRIAKMAKTQISRMIDPIFFT
jgi:hypothetical protein